MPQKDNHLKSVLPKSTQPLNGIKELTPVTDENPKIIGFAGNAAAALIQRITSAAYDMPFASAGRYAQYSAGHPMGTDIKHPAPLLGVYAQPTIGQPNSNSYQTIILIPP